MNSYRTGRNQFAYFLMMVGLALAAGVFVLGRDMAPINIWLAVAIAIVSVFVPQSLMMANQWERAVVLRLGKLQGIKGPGLFVIIPSSIRSPPGSTSVFRPPSSTPNRR